MSSNASSELLRIGEIMKIAGVASTVAFRALAAVAAMRGQNPELPAPIEHTEPTRFSTAASTESNDPATPLLALAAKKHRRSTAGLSQRTRMLLHEQLAGGPMPEPPVMAAAEAAEIPER